MNFKTTLVLVALLAVAGLAVLLTRESSEEKKKTETAAEQQKLLNVKSEDVTRIVVTPASGAKTALEKSNGKWRLTEPVAAAAESFEVDSLVRAITELESTSSASAGVSAGLDKPQYTVDFTTADGKSRTLNVGNKTAVGDSLYVALKDDKSVHVVSPDLLERLRKPASDYRDPKLVEITEPQVQQVTITKPDGKIVLVKSGKDWKVTEPSAMPADENEVQRIVSALTSLRAAEFVSENIAEASQYQLDQPRYSATLSAASPTTLPIGIAATAPATAPATQPSVTIKFGRYEDVTKENVMVLSSQTPAIAKVSATIIATLNKKPLELRDRKVLDVDPAQVSTITINSDLAATTKPTSRPASKKDITLKRRHEAVALGPAVPATKPSTKPATTTASTTRAATAPATQPLTKWEVSVGAEMKPAADTRIDTLLSQLHPLRVTKYLDAAPATQPSASYVVKITSQPAAGAPAQAHEIRLVDPGNSQPLIGTYNGLAFEVDRFLIDRLSGDFERGAAPPPRGLPDENEPPPFGAPHGLE